MFNIEFINILANSFSSIPNTYKHLQIRGIARSSRNDQNGSFANVQVGNGTVDTGSNYSWHFINGYGSGTQAISRASQTARSRPIRPCRRPPPPSRSRGDGAAGGRRAGKGSESERMTNAI